jgi:hypothetical protein
MPAAPATTTPAVPGKLPPPRLAKPPYAVAIGDGAWDVLCSSIFPTATEAKSIWTAWQLCQERNLNIFKKPFHIVKMWNSLAGREVEMVLPSINELLVTASRAMHNGQPLFAGVDPPIFGQPITHTFKGRKKGKDGNWNEIEITLTYPETVAITVYRMVNGERRAYTSPIRWREEYQRVGGGELPNDMWARRVYDQAQKVALAASLRVAFPEETGGEEDDLSVAQQPGEAEIVVEDKPAPPNKTLPSNQLKPGEIVDPDTGEIVPAQSQPTGPHTLETDENEQWQAWGKRLIDKVNASKTEAEINQWVDKNRTLMDRFKEEAPVVFNRLDAAINKAKIALNTENNA